MNNGFNININSFIGDLKSTIDLFQNVDVYTVYCLTITKSRNAENNSICRIMFRILYIYSIILHLNEICKRVFSSANLWQICQFSARVFGHSAILGRGVIYTSACRNPRKSRTPTGHRVLLPPRRSSGSGGEKFFRQIAGWNYANSLVLLSTSSTEVTSYQKNHPLALYDEPVFAFSMPANRCDSMAYF